MKLSEAMRAGITGYKTKRTYYDLDPAVFGKVIGCCAMGAVFRGANFDINQSWMIATEIWPELNLKTIKPPAQHLFQDSNSYSLFQIITGLNDYTNWTREQIADWLESIGY